MFFELWWYGTIHLQTPTIEDDESVVDMHSTLSTHCPTYHCAYEDYFVLFCWPDKGECRQFYLCPKVYLTIF